MKLYEGMFIFPLSMARENRDGVFDNVRSLIAKFDGVVKHIEVWAERTMTYEIKKNRDGAYVLCYFEAPAESIAKIERQVVISDEILRSMILTPEKGFDLDTWLQEKENKKLEEENAGIKENAPAESDDDESSDDDTKSGDESGDYDESDEEGDSGKDEE